MLKLQFLGATGTVTGSKYLLTAGRRRILVDCGLFQGLKQLRLRNWERLPVEPRTVDAVVLTHAHIDHSGYLPLFAKNGFRGKVLCSGATRDLCEILLPDAGYLQEEEAEYANRRGFSKHSPALPLYTQEDARRCLPQLVSIGFDKDVDLGGGVALRLHRSGHIVGAAMAELRYRDLKVLFTGDLGRPNDPLMPPPARIARTDTLIVESTYGDRRHDPADPRVLLAEIINRTIGRGGVVLVPVYAVGRAQSLMYYLRDLKTTQAIPDVPVYLNSPMAVDATRIFREHPADHRLTPEQCQAMCSVATVVNTVEESKRLNSAPAPMIVLAASGMATGGRVLHHLKSFAPDPRNTILFVGFQAAGTRGAAMLNGAHSVKIHGEYVPVRAEVRAISNLSAHADSAEILDWLDGFESAPRQTYITHGEPTAADTLRHRIEEGKRWACRVPDYKEIVELN